MRNLFDNSKYAVRLRPDFGGLLRLCTAKEATRYALECVEFNEDCIAASDGKRLLKVDVRHNQEVGLYRITSDNFLVKLPENDLRFPKYNDIIPETEDAKELVVGNLEGDGSPILFELSKAGVYVHAQWIIDLEKYLLELHVRDLALFVHEEKPQERAFMLTGEFGGMDKDASFTYVQMPLSQR